MLGYIQKYWWLMLAWLLAMFGDDSFWHFNVMELFATISIITGAIITVVKYRKDHNRKLKLIDFPNNWKAYRRVRNNILETHIIADVFLAHHAVSYKAFADIEGKVIPIQWSNPQQSRMAGQRWIMEGKVDLSFIPKGTKTILLSIEIQLDGGIKKSSGKRIVDIIDS